MTLWRTLAVIATVFGFVAHPAFLCAGFVFMIFAIEEGDDE